MEEIPDNESRWNELARRGVLCSQPKLSLGAEEAREYINRHGFHPEDLNGKDVLCLASGGGQQSIGFALLGAKVTVVDFSEEQLAKDEMVARQYQVDITAVKSDMRDLSFCADESFDIVYQPYSINYVPEVDGVFDEVSRILRPGGKYDLMLHNPYVHGSWKDGCWEKEWRVEELWRDKGYPIWQPYRDGYPIRTVDGHWNFTDPAGETVRLPSPQEYRHTMATVINGLLRRGMELLHFKEEVGTGYDQPPGSWEHYISRLPPWWYLLSRKK